jgi:hypothetical protein
VGEGDGARLLFGRADGGDDELCGAGVGEALELAGDLLIITGHHGVAKSPAEEGVDPLEGWTGSRSEVYGPYRWLLQPIEWPG